MQSGLHAFLDFKKQRFRLWHATLSCCCGLTSFCITPSYYPSKGSCHLGLWNTLGMILFSALRYLKDLKKQKNPGSIFCLCWSKSSMHSPYLNKLRSKSRNLPNAHMTSQTHALISHKVQCLQRSFQDHKGSSLIVTPPNHQHGCDLWCPPLPM